MKTKGYKNSGFSIIGAVIFFVTIALIIQIAILVYDYIIERTQDNALIAVLILAVVFILSGVCTVVDVIRRKIMVERPVARILAATEKIASGNFDVRVDIDHVYSKYDEYDLIAENINKMAAELRKSEVLNTDFVSNMSHEFKTPLAVIHSYSAELARPDISPQMREKYAKTLRTATEKLGDLVSNILKLNKLENQNINPECERVNLADMLAEAVLRFEEQIAEKELVLNCEIEDVIVNSSPSYLEIIWNNLISNAVKFTEPGGEIGVRVYSDGNLANVVISDTGCGISSESGKRIFEKFYQGDTSHSSEGNGLGLALVQRVVDILGGEITVESRVGVGTTFKIVLRGAVDA